MPVPVNSGENFNSLTWLRPVGRGVNDTRVRVGPWSQGAGGMRTELAELEATAEDNRHPFAAGELLKRGGNKKNPQRVAMQRKFGPDPHHFHQMTGSHVTSIYPPQRGV